ncbi:MAG TPA: histidine kinase dimerization/phospho-acceptor domain-containing protein, partial [Gemmatimonadaceae bacterium]|nr:histidine kinase dimerization/phospho-acceptor domain-containing protein [Gemmatimonadaceae bacterium]
MTVVTDAAGVLPVALLTPTGADGPVAARVLGSAGMITRICRDIQDACEVISGDDAGVLVVAEEALGPAAREKLFESLNNQPSWSDIPIILLTGQGELSKALPHVLRGVAAKGNVTLLERPIRVATLTTVIRSAQRARRRQLDVRDYIENRHAIERSLRESEARLRSAVHSAPYPMMLHAEDGEILQLSQAWTTLSGYDAGSLARTGDWSRLALIEPNTNGADPSGEFFPVPVPEGESAHLGERAVKTADGTTRTWDFHRVALGHLPDGRRIQLTAAMDVTDYKLLVESERTARMQAEEANSAKSQFLATMSHELRTPLNAIAGYTQLLALGVRGEINPEQKEDLERIDRSQRHLLSLINDILNFAKIEAGHVAIETAVVDVDELLGGLQQFVEPQLREKNLSFTMRVGSNDMYARADADKVRQILLNLISNAVKFTPEGGRIELASSSNRKSICIRVSDNGGG